MSDRGAGPLPMRDLPFGSTDCFACGRQNPHGLHMRFRTDGERVYSDVSIPPHLRGWSTLAHGGTLSAIMDEIMAWTAMFFERRYILTRSMQVHFLRPVRIETSLVAAGRVESRPDERTLVTAAEILDRDGRAGARARGEFALFAREAFEKLGILPAAALDELERMFGSAR